ncbi:hypothetical protein CWR43_16905 [Rhizobium sullae]|uniref:Uncharacterized protein n=1 Tax=Rhizobium sullae TaxID=50338 RepID=A0A2N0D8S4_RHISU|nr:hypothetical protein CWR43_16905 [Rhizobium sullae]
MRAAAIKPFRCVCEECEPLPPIEGLSEPLDNEAASRGVSPKELWLSVAQKDAPETESRLSASRVPARKCAAFKRRPDIDGAQIE